MGYYARLKRVVLKTSVFDFSEKQMRQYFSDLSSGASPDRALATMLGCPENKDSAKFLKKTLTKHEYERISIELERKYRNI